MNIAFCHNAFIMGGAERITLDIVQYLSTFGEQYKVYLFAPEFAKENFPQDIVQKFTWCKTRNRSKEKAEDVEQLIKEHNIDVVVEVVSHLKKVKKIKQRTGVKVIYANHGVPFWQYYQQIHHLQSTPTKKILWKLYRKFWWETLGNARRKAIRQTRRSYTESDAYVVLCEAYKKETCLSLGISPKQSHIYAINNSEKQVENPNLNKENIILYCGRFSYNDKRVDRLIRIWGRIEKLLPDWRLQLVGDGPERTNLQSLTEQLGLQRVSFEGATKNPQQYYNNASIVCLTSQMEGWPLALTESLVNGCIDVAFGCSAGIKEILSPHGENGFIVTPYDEEEFANTLLHICQLPEEQKTALRLNAIEKCKAYSPSIILEQWRQLFETVVQQP